MYGSCYCSRPSWVNVADSEWTARTVRTLVLQQAAARCSTSNYWWKKPKKSACTLLPPQSASSSSDQLRRRRQPALRRIVSCCTLYDTRHLYGVIHWAVMWWLQRWCCCCLLLVAAALAPFNWTIALVYHRNWCEHNVQNAAQSRKRNETYRRGVRCGSNAFCNARTPLSMKFVYTIRNMYTCTGWTKAKVCRNICPCSGTV